MLATGAVAQESKSLIAKWRACADAAAARYAQSTESAPVAARLAANHVADQGTPPEVGASSTCPDCGTEMVIIHITPIFFVSEFEELTLACKKCGSTKILKIKRS